MNSHLIVMLILSIFYVFSSFKTYESNVKVKIMSGYVIRITDFSLILICIFLSIYFVGSRPIDGEGDTWNYVNTFSGLTSFTNSRYDGEIMFGNSELFFWPFSYLLKWIGFEERSWLIIMLCIPILCIFLSFKKIIKSKYLLVIYLGLFFSYYLVFFCAIRQSLAEGFVMLSLVYAFSKRLDLSILFSFIAIGFHQSAIISLAFPLLVNIKLNRFFISFAIFFALLSSTIASDFLLNIFEYFGFNSVTDKMELYQSGGYSGEFNNLFLHKQFLLLFFTTLIYLFIAPKDNLIYKFVFYILFLIFFFWSSPIMSGRMMSYLTIVFPILIWELLGQKLDEEKQVVTFTLFFSFIGFAVISTESTQLALGLF